MSAWLIGIIHNLTLLLSLGLLYYLLRQWLPRTRRLSNALFGALCGGVGILCMATAFVYQPGVVFDSRTVVMALAGLFGGGSGGLIAMAVTGGYRWSLAGPGLWAGLASIMAAGMTGILARRLIGRSNWPPTPWQLWSTGLAANLLAFACLSLLPETVRVQAMINSVVPFLGIYPLAVVAIGTIMSREESRSSSLARLRHAEWLFSEAQKLTRFGSWEYRLDNDWLTATPYFHDLLGLPENTAPLSLQDFFGRLHREDWDSVRLAFDAAIDGKSEIDVQGRLLADAGRELWVRVVGKPIVIKEKTTQLVGNLIDITRRKTSELELRASEERLQAILDHARALICICDLQGKILLANRHFKVFGKAGGAAVGRPLYELLPRAGALEQWVDDMVALQAGEHVEFEEVLWHADDTVHTYLVSKFLLADSSQRPASICYIATDISELRRSFAERQQLTEELTAKNDELERFTYSVSHDLKAPLLTIGSYSELLREDLAADDPDRVAEDLGHIREAVDKMRELIDDLLELSRIGQAHDEMAPVDLNRVLAEVQALLAGDIRRAGARIVTAPDLPTVRGDALRLRQAMQNLVQNALKFGAPGRPLLIDINWKSDPDGGIQVTVGDNGRGIAAEALPRIFDLFAHGTGMGTGSGIGLALVRRIMEIHGGEVRAESAGLDTGSTFILRFPALPIPGKVPADGAECLDHVS
ncbi:MAG: ATP-binding protein [Desulfuromonadales bacterium]